MANSSSSLRIERRHDACTILEGLASDSTVCGGQSGQSAIQGTLATESLLALLVEQKGPSIAHVALVSYVREDRRQTAIQPAPQSVLQGAANLAASLATDENGCANLIKEVHSCAWCDHQI